MKRKTNFLRLPLLIVGALVAFIMSSCKKEDNNVPVVSTSGVTEISMTTAISGGNISDDGGTTVTACGVCWSKSNNPTITDKKTINSYGTGCFTSILFNLEPNTTYYVRAYATNSAGTGYGNAKSFTTQEEENADSFTDSRDGNVYKTVTIGNQVWMAENLKYLPSVVGSETGSFKTPYYYVYEYDGTNVNEAKATANYTIYGVLYNWTAAMNSTTSSSNIQIGGQGVCPTGWHLPSDAEWTELTDYLGGKNVAGGKLKETGTMHWYYTNSYFGATNETGFTARPGGGRDDYGYFCNYEYAGLWWSATEDYAYDARYWLMQYDRSNVSSYSANKEYGFSVRCVRD